MADSKSEVHTEKCPHCKNEITGNSTSRRNHKIKCKGVDVTKDLGWIEDAGKNGDKSGGDKSNADKGGATGVAGHK